MSKFLKTLRNNWKKSTLFAVTVIYGVNYAHEKYKIEQLMRAYCEEAIKFGEIPVPPTLKPRTITVILNPAANKRKAKVNFEKYCAPLLHLAGFTVDIKQTESEGQARKLVSELKDTDVIVVAGGDGTLSETVTGLMRTHGYVRWPLGVLPMGRTNSVACSLLQKDREGNVSPADMAEAAMAIVRGNTKAIDCIRIDVQDEEKQPVYGLSGIKWGLYRDVLSRQDSYWFLGALRGYAAVLFSSFNTEPIAAHVVFTHACSGCSRCYETRPDLHPPPRQRWYHYLVPSFNKKAPELPMKNYKEVTNKQCGVVSEVDLKGIDICVSSPCVCHNSKGVRVALGPTNPTWSEYVEEGWRRVRGEHPNSVSQLEAQHLEIIPLIESGEKEERWFSIDNEEYEVKPIRVTLVPNSVKVFIPQPAKTSYTLLEWALLGCC